MATTPRCFLFVACPGAFGAAGAAPVQPAGVTQQPYGVMQQLPQVNVPEQVMMCPVTGLLCIGKTQDMAWHYNRLCKIHHLAAAYPLSSVTVHLNKPVSGRETLVKHST
jgi:hypothetical protein